MPTLTTFRGKELPSSFAQKIGAAPNARVEIKIFQPEEEREQRRKEAVEEAMRLMDTISDEAEAAGITDQDIQDVLNEK